MVDIPDPDRPRGVLSESDRLYCMDPENYKTRQARHTRKEAIVERIRNAFFDMSILADPEFDEELLTEAFRDPGGGTVGEAVGPWSDRKPEERLKIGEEISQAFVETVALIAHVCDLGHYRWVIEEGTKTAVSRSERDYVVVDASYDPTIERPEGARNVARWRLEHDYPLTEEEVILLLKEEDIDPDDVAENVRTRGIREPGLSREDIENFRESFEEWLEDEKWVDAPSGSDEE